MPGRFLAGIVSSGALRRNVRARAPVLVSCRPGLATKPLQWQQVPWSPRDQRCGALRWVTTVNGNQLKPKDLIRHLDRIWEVKSAAAVRTGKGGAYAQVCARDAYSSECVAHELPQLELRDVVNGKKRNERVRAAESIEVVEMDRKRKFTFLYQEGDKLVLMEDETYEQIEILAEALGSQTVFLTVRRG